MDKNTYLKEKITNFIIFIDQKIGKDNIIYSDFVKYQKDINLFLTDFIKLSKIEITDEGIYKYLAFKNVNQKLEKEDLNKTKRYFEMFQKVINL